MLLLWWDSSLLIYVHHLFLGLRFMESSREIPIKVVLPNKPGLEAKCLGSTIKSKDHTSTIGNSSTIPLLAKQKATMLHLGLSMHPWSPFLLM